MIYRSAWIAKGVNSGSSYLVTEFISDGSPLYTTINMRTGTVKQVNNVDDLTSREDLVLLETSDTAMMALIGEIGTRLKPGGSHNVKYDQLRTALRSVAGSTLKPSEPENVASIVVSLAPGHSDESHFVRDKTGQWLCLCGCGNDFTWDDLHTLSKVTAT